MRFFLLAVLLPLMLATLLAIGAEAPAVQFIDIAAKSGLTIPNTFGGKDKKDSILESTGTGVAVFDFNGDGANDVFIANGPPSRSELYKNDGAGLPVTGTRWGSGCAFIDYDRDGLLDIFVANYVDLDLANVSSKTCDWKGMAVWCGPHGLPAGHNALYHNNGDGTFTDVSAKAGILAPGGRYGLGVVTADFDNDGWPDIYVACDQTPSLLYRNNHDGTFQERGDAAGVAYNADGRLQAGMGIAVADYDGNGFLDIAKTNFSGDRPSLFRNEDRSVEH